MITGDANQRSSAPDLLLKIYGISQAQQEEVEVHEKWKRQRSGEEDVDMNAGKLQIEYLPITKPRVDPKNPRKHSHRHLRQIGRSIKAFGFIIPVLVDADFNIIAGHGRVMAARDLGLTEVPVIKVEHLSEAQIKAYRIADNRLSECSEWDEKLLPSS
jgi:hypothetical protein